MTFSPSQNTRNLSPFFDRFLIDGPARAIVPTGEGHIHETYLVTTDHGRYILQRLNTNLFTNPDELMENFLKVSEHLRKKVLARGGDPDRECLRALMTREGKAFWKEGEAAYRLFPYIEKSICHQVADRPGVFRESATAFGQFAADLADFDATKLHEILPGFHDTVLRFDQFQQTLAADSHHRAASCQPEIEFARKRESLCGAIVNPLNAKTIPLRVVHNDTKLNNVLFDIDTGKALAVLDWDTIMPGSLCTDFGDAIRYGCNTGAEDERDLNLVHFSLPLFEEFAEGYLRAAGSLLTDAEIDHLVLGAMVITLENGLRFLTDYLNGDRYYPIVRQGQNLDRCRTQFRLVEEMERQRIRMEEIVYTLSSKK